MSVVSPGDETIYNDANSVWIDPVLNVEPLREYATATVAADAVYPVETVTVTGGSADWLSVAPDQIFRIERADGKVVAWGVVRKTPTASLFYPDVKSNGDFGYATDEGISIETDDVVRVYSNHNAWAMISRVVNIGGSVVQNKRWDLAYTNQNSAPPPVVILGHDQQASVDSGSGLATFSFDASSSYGWTSGETITSFLYTLPSGAVVVGGAVNTAVVSFTVPGGVYEIKCAITSSTGATQTGYRTVYANDPAKANSLVDGDMENVGVGDWTAGNSAALTKETGTPHGDSQVLRVAYNAVDDPYAAQTVMTISWIYNLRGYTRSDGVRPPRILNGAVVIWTGTASTEWQLFDVTFAAVSDEIRFETQAAASGYTEWDDIVLAQDNRAFGNAFPIEAIGSDVTDINGWEASFTVLGDAKPYLYPGAKCHFYAPVLYDDNQLTDNDAFIDVFIGYLDTISITTNSRRVKQTTLTFKSPLKICQQLPSATQEVVEVANPANWQQIAVGLSDPAFVSWYILYWHTTVLNIHDFIYESELRNLRRRGFRFGQDTVAAHLQLLGTLMSGDVGCRSDGTITLTREPSLKNSNDRNALDNKFTWTENNLRDMLSITPRFRPPSAHVIMAGIAYAGNPNAKLQVYKSIAPGNAATQGVSKTELPGIIITIAGGVDELYAITGHQYGLQNNPLERLQMPAHRALDIAEPADSDWHTLNVEEDAYLPVNMDKFGVRWSASMRFRPTRVNRQWQRVKNAWIKTVNNQMRRETFGTPGVFYPVYDGQLAPQINPLTGWHAGLRIAMPDVTLEFDSVAGGLPDSGDWFSGFAFNDLGQGGYTSDWNDIQSNWVNTTPDSFVDLGGITRPGQITGMRLSRDGTGYAFQVIAAFTGEKVVDFSIIANPDIETDPTDWTKMDNWGGTSQSLNTMFVFANSQATSVVWIPAYNIHVLTKTAATPDFQYFDFLGGASDIFETSTEWLPGMAMDGTTQWVTGRYFTGLGNPPAYRIYKRTTIPGTFTTIANHPGSGGGMSRNPMPCIVRSGTDILATYKPLGTSNFQLYRIDDTTTTWTNVTPSGDYVPLRPNALVADSGNLWMIGTNPSGDRKLFISDDNGDTWTDNGSTQYEWLRRLSSDDVFVLGGIGIMDITNDGFVTFHDRLGGWGRDLGSVSIMQDFDSLGLV